MIYTRLILGLLLFLGVSKSNLQSFKNFTEPKTTEIGQQDITISNFLTHQVVSPMLAGKDENTVFQFSFNANGSGTTRLESIKIDLEGTTNIHDIKHVNIFYDGSSNDQVVKKKFGNTLSPGKQLIFKGDLPIAEGQHQFSISVALNKNINLLDRIKANCQSIVFSNGQQIKPEVKKSKVSSQKVSIALRQRGENHVDTYRIPGLATTNDGSLIAVYDVRYGNSGDLQGNIDIGMSRSTNDGRTWEPMQVIMDMGRRGNKSEDQNGIGDPSILVDRNTGTIWVAALWAHGMKGKKAWFASGQGFTPDETGQFMLVKSTDDGQTWSEPINITSQIKKKEWKLMFQGPGKGITMRNGTLVFPAQFKDENDIPHSTIIYSKDHGKSWNVGTGAKSNTTEAQVVELSNGELMLNMRDNRGGSRSVYTTDDLGKTWRKHPTSRSALQEPVCMASLIRWPVDKDWSQRRLLFSNPNNTKSRVNMTIKMSTDDGMTWPKNHQILLNAKQGYGYSCMTVINKKTVGILYEGVGELYFQNVNISELQ